MKRKTHKNTNWSQILSISVSLRLKQKAKDCSGTTYQEFLPSCNRLRFVLDDHTQSIVWNRICDDVRYGGEVE